MKKYSTPLAIKEMKVKITLRLHLTLVRTAVIKETNNAGEDEATAFLIHC
jgi:hypothetical protein